MGRCTCDVTHGPLSQNFLGCQQRDLLIRCFQTCCVRGFPKTCQYQDVRCLAFSTCCHGRLSISIRGVLPPPALQDAVTQQQSKEYLGRLLPISCPGKSGGNSSMQGRTAGILHACSRGSEALSADRCPAHSCKRQRHAPTRYQAMLQTAAWQLQSAQQEDVHHTSRGSALPTSAQGLPSSHIRCRQAGRSLTHMLQKAK